MRLLFSFFLILVSANSIFAQNEHTTEVKFLENEQWWGGAVALGSQMPYVKPLKEFNLASQNYNNQVVPFFYRIKAVLFGAKSLSNSRFKIKQYKLNRILKISKFNKLVLR